MQQLVEANIVAVHAFQISLAKKTSRGDANCFSGSALSDHQLETLVNHQSSLLSFDPKEVAAWARGQSSSFDPSKDLLPILSAKLQIPRSAPVSTFTEYLRKEVKGTEVGIRAVANLYQTVLEVERDGDVLQQEFDLYVVLGLPVYLGQMGLPGGDSDFLVSGKELADHTCASPFDTDAAAWQIAGRKIWNWGEKEAPHPG